MSAIKYEPIGLIHSPHRQLSGMPIQPAAAVGIEGSVEVYPDYADGLKDLEGFSHIILLYHLHRAGKFKLHVTPFLDTTPRGVFATRAPSRPNPIGLSIVELRAIEGGRLEIANVDILDGTPLLDIKPYIPETSRIEGVRTGWLSSAGADMQRGKADDRFSPGD